MAVKLPIYMDHNATTPLDPRVFEAMRPFFMDVFGNAASRGHSFGWEAEAAVDKARQQVAALLNARPDAIVWTSGSTEANNLAIKGAAEAHVERGRHIITQVTEHKAVLDCCKRLKKYGFETTWLGVDSKGRISLDELRESIRPDTILVSVMWANNEIGTILPVRELAEAAAEFGVPLHSDAVQAFGQVPVDFAASGLAAMTLSGHKIGGPYGIGALVLGREHTPVPVLHGGGQERHVRSGTLDVPAIASFAVAGRLAAEQREWFAREIGALRDALVAAVREAVPDAVLGGDPAPGGRLPANAHFTFPGCEGDSLLLLLDAQGIECSTGSACTAGVAQPSHVLLATGTDPDLARGTLRFSLGHTSTEADVEALAKAIGPAVERARAAGLT